MTSSRTYPALDDHIKRLVPYGYTDGPRYRGLMERVFMAHRGQVDKQGVPYYKHLEQVASLVYVPLRLCAYAHDVLEDTDTTKQDLLEWGFSPHELKVLDLLTQPKNMDYRTYIYWMQQDSRAVAIKIADIVSNLSRVSTLDKATADRLQYKYYEALTLIAIGTKV